MSVKSIEEVLHATEVLRVFCYKSNTYQPKNRKNQSYTRLT